jgi:hypothetical protein
LSDESRNQQHNATAQRTGQHDTGGIEYLFAALYKVVEVSVFSLVLHFYYVFIGVEVYQVLTYFLSCVYLKTVSPW